MNVYLEHLRMHHERGAGGNNASSVVDAHDRHGSNTDVAPHFEHFGNAGP